MGNREDLMAGARKAILERGLAKVTARDIASAAGVSLAAIGYHFGSKDRLVTEALTEESGSGIGDSFEAAIRDAGEGRSLSEAVPIGWNDLLDVVREHHEQLLLSLENAVRIARSEESQAYMMDAVNRGQNDLAEILRSVHPTVSEAEAKAVGKLYFTMFQGLAMLWMLAPEADLISGDDLALALKTLAGK